MTDETTAAKLDFNPEAMTAAQVAKYLGIGESTVRDAYKAQPPRLAYYRYGVGQGTVRFRLADVEDYRQRCRVEAAAKAVRREVVAVLPADIRADAKRLFGL